MAAAYRLFHCFRGVTLLSLVLFPPLAAAQTTGPIERTLPPRGIEVAEADRAKLREACDALAARLEKARLNDSAAKLEPRLPDVEIYLKAVRFALENGEFFNAREIPWAFDQLKSANLRLDQLLSGSSPWNKVPGLVVRGYRSRLDRSLQPYGLVIPEQLNLEKPCPLVVWLHGRGDTLSEVNFIHERESSRGQVTPPWAIVLHAYGRYCNAFKFAGEVDVFEAIEDAKRNYNIDPDRVVLWGFSMGGAGAWHLAAHHPDRWAAVCPGAGFVDTARYQNIKPENYPVWYEQTLWNLFDVPRYTRSLFNVPLVAYNGEIDKQRLSAEIMDEAFSAHGHKLHQVIGPGMGHKYHPDSLAELNKLMEGYAKLGRVPYPAVVTLETRTLRYGRAFWVEMLGLQRHWDESRVDAHLLDDSKLSVVTRNATALQLTWPGEKITPNRAIEIDSQTLAVPADGLAHAVIGLEKVDGHWQINPLIGRGSALRKMPGLQGPIDDVFMEPFLVVTPSGKCAHEQVEAWVQAELAHFRDRWRRLFRGDLLIKRDTEVTFEDMQTQHLILWGDRVSNRVIEKVAAHLPIFWTAENIIAGDRKFASSGHALSLIFPNPLHQRPTRYIVLNSGPTFREGHDKTNSLQNPKLPDWAVIDLSVPADGLQPGKVVDAGFFDEQWKLRKDEGVTR